MSFLSASSALKLTLRRIVINSLLFINNYTAIIVFDDMKFVF